MAFIRVEQDGGVAMVTMDRPDARNALSRALVAEFRAALAELSADDGLRAVIVRGSGTRAFCAGADLVERTTLSAEERVAHLEAIWALCEELVAVPVPVIAAIRGFCLAGGGEVALACDVRVAAEDAVFGFPEVAVGIFPGAGGVIRLPRVVGHGVARELLYTGRRIDAAEAHRIGLVDRVVQPGTELATAWNVAREIAANAPLAIRAMKRALAVADGLPPGEAAPLVMAERLPLDRTADYAEGIAAFAAKRPPRFEGT